MNPLARTAGHALAATALALAFAAAAQPQAHAPESGQGGLLPWVFAAFVAAAIVGIFLFVLWIVRGPRRPVSDPPGAAPRPRSTGHA